MNQQTLQENVPKQLDRVLGFFARVEAKASFVFAINSALLGALALNIQKIDFTLWPNTLAIFAAALFLALSFCFVYRCSFPSLQGGDASLIYFKEIAKLREQDYIMRFRSMSEEDYLDDLLSQAWRNSEILTEKFKAIQTAFVLTGFALVPWSIFLVLASLTHTSAPVLK